MREQAMMNQGNPEVGVLPKPILERQPAPPEAAAVRLFNPEDEMNFEKHLCQYNHMGKEKRKPCGG